MKIFISGSLAYDRIMTFPGRFGEHILPEKIHILNVCFMVDGLKEKFGGTAGNIGYSLSLLGELPTILATCGDDFARYEARLQDLGLPLEGIRKIPDELTAGAYITTDQADNQITAFNSGAMNHESKYDFSGVDPAGTIAIISPGNLTDMLVYAEKYRELGIPYICDPGQSIPAFSGPELTAMLTGAQILITNDYELEMIRQATGLTRDQILERCRAVITTLGEKGSDVITPNSEEHIPAIRVDRALDPTGAGDAYRSGLLKGLALGRDLVGAARVGAVSAGYAVEHHGTQEHSFTQDEFWARYRENFGDE